MSEGQNIFWSIKGFLDRERARREYRQKTIEADRNIAELVDYLESKRGVPWTELSFIRSPGSVLSWNENHKGGVVRVQHKREDGNDYYTHAFIFDSYSLFDEAGNKFPLVMVEELPIPANKLDRFVPLLPQKAADFSTHYSRAFSVSGGHEGVDEIVKVSVYLRGTGESRGNISRKPKFITGSI